MKYALELGADLLRAHPMAFGFVSFCGALAYGVAVLLAQLSAVRGG